jgi:hypothetical protein
MSVTIEDLKEYQAKNDLENVVRDIIFSESEGHGELEGFFKDLFEHGCRSGMIGSLVYYIDTYTFFEKHLEDIVELWDKIEEETGESLEIPKGENKINWLAWFGFEETARKIYQNLGGKNY